MERKIKIWSLLIIVLLGLGISSCSKEDHDNNSQFVALFSKTDYYVNKLKATTKGYSDSSKTSDGEYTVTILGRLIVVKKNYSSGETYSTIKNALKNHYKSNSTVKDVFQNNAGTITIDCRN